ncbi:hypothetical protein HF086_005101 [Spodoptera exigua]|uniref:Mpv17-like protein 2 n=1 Tax=Spodoptera exigua TaxID=7107 RepID=A0A922MS75_SPOEX|nr:hypothetical protein HF086_005101 [Spodoptera exigua]
MVMRRALSTAYKSYKSAIDNAFSPKNLLYTNVMISMGSSSCGDLLQQSYEIVRKNLVQYDFQRSTQMAVSGFTSGVICHHWYIILDRFIVGRSLYMVIKKLLLDQCICSPIVILSFFATVALFEDDPFDNFTSEVSQKFWTLYKAEWIVWPPAQIINFYFLPTKYRVAYDNTISFGYDIYTSHVKHSKIKATEKENVQRNDNE